MSNVPKLRFKEFEEEWNVVSLESLLQSISYGMNAASKLYDGENRYLRITDIDEEKRQYIDENKVSPDGNLSNKFLLNEGDLLFARTGASTGKSFIYKNKYGKMYYAGFLIRARLKENINPYFVYLQTLNSSYYNWVRIMSMRSGQPGINAEEYKKLQISITSKLEQDKIANFLETLERKILRQQEKIELLKEQKKGYMQKIFNRELRFKDEHGKTFPESREYNFANFLEIPLKEKEENPIKENLLTVKLHLKGIAVSENIATLKIGSTTYYKRKAGQFIYGKQNLFNGAFGIVPEELDGFLSSGDIPTLDFKKEFIEPLYFYYYLSQWNVYKRMENVSTGTGSKRIHEGELLKQKMRLPCLDEQKQIVNFLKTFEKKILLEEERLKEIEKQKQGFMQQMFV